MISDLKFIRHSLRESHYVDVVWIRFSQVEELDFFTVFDLVILAGQTFLLQRMVIHQSALGVERRALNVNRVLVSVFCNPVHASWEADVLDGLLPKLLMSF